MEICRKHNLSRRDYNHHRPYSALNDRTPAEVAATCAAAAMRVRELALEHASRLPLNVLARRT
jgi:hypothetical protein